MLSIIIPVLNEASTIASTLEHVLTLEGDYEVIVVDGGSADDTVVIASRYARVLRSERGRGSQMNVGARAARGNLLLFLHADTLLPPGAIARVEQVFSDSRLVGGRFKVELSHPGWVFRIIAFMINLRDYFFRGFTGDQAIFIRADIFRDLGGYREIPLMEDLDLSKRMMEAGRVIRLPLSVTTSSRRWEKDGVVKTIVLMWLLRLLYVSGLPPSRLKRLYGETR